MEEKLDEVLKRLEGLKDRLEDRESTFSKALHIAEKLIIPILLGVLAFVAARAGNQIAQAQFEIAKSQLNLTESAEKDRREETRRTIQAKYVEIFYKEINSGEAKKQKAAINLLRLIDDEFASKLANLVERTPGIPAEVRSDAGKIKEDILNRFKIGIYFLQGQKKLAQVAAEIQKQLLSNGFKGATQLYPKPNSFFEEAGQPESFEIRYEPGLEDAAADALAELLNKALPQYRFDKWPVMNRTRDFISIFLIPQG